MGKIKINKKNNKEYIENNKNLSKDWYKVEQTLKIVRKISHKNKRIRYSPHYNFNLLYLLKKIEVE